MWGSAVRCHPAEMRLLCAALFFGMLGWAQPGWTQNAPAKAPASDPAADEAQQLSQALSEAGNSPVDFVRALEKHLAKYPNSTRRNEIERALVDRKSTRLNSSHANIS